MDWKQGKRRSLGCTAVVIGLLLMAGVSNAADDEEGWSGELAAAVTAQSGTTDTFSGSIDAKGERTWDSIDQVIVRFNGVYGTSRQRTAGNTETIQNSQGLYGDWKHIIHKRFFWDTGSEIFRDNTQDLEVRATLGTGPGYRFWEAEEPAKRHFDASVGVGYRYEIYDGNTGGTVSENGDTDHFADIIARAEYRNMLFDDRVEYTHTVSGRMPANAPDSYILRTELIVGIPITEAWSFRTSFLAEYVANPGADEVNNTTTRTSVGLGYKF